MALAPALCSERADARLSSLLLQELDLLFREWSGEEAKRLSAPAPHRGSQHRRVTLAGKPPSRPAPHYAGGEKKATIHSPTPGSAEDRGERAHVLGLDKNWLETQQGVMLGVKISERGALPPREACLVL